MDAIFEARDKCLSEMDFPLIAGIINVTPDSFSDGGKYFDVEDALSRATSLIERGAKILDIGGESTRPGSVEITEEEEIKRIVPVIKAIRDEGIETLISVDTWRSNVACHAIDAGADIINDITGLLGDEKMASVIGEKKSSVIIMFNPIIARPDHEGSRMFRKFGYGDAFTLRELEEFSNLSIVDAMKAYFDKSLELAFKCGIERKRIMLDPGIGFGLTMRENLELLKSVDIIHQMGYCSFVGVSRKRFIINMLKNAGFNADIVSSQGLIEADNASAFLSAILASKGVGVLRVHEVDSHYKACMIGKAIRNPSSVKDANFSQYKERK